MTNQHPEMFFPSAYNAAAEDLNDPRLASAVLATVAQALDHVRISAEHAGPHAAQTAEEAQWERERPKGMPRSTWMRQKRAERDERAAQG